MKLSSFVERSAALFLLAAVDCSSAADGEPMSSRAAAAASGGGPSEATGRAGNTGVGERAAAGMPAAGTSGSSGASGMSGSAAGGGGAATAPKLGEVYEMLYSMSCAVCHSMAPSDNSNGMLGMIRSQEQFYDALVNKPMQGSMCAGKGTYIVPGDVEKSVILQKLSASAPCGASMPLGGMLQPAQVRLLSDWIAGGALKD